MLFLVVIGDFPNFYKKMEIVEGVLYGDNNCICDAIYVQSIKVVDLETIKSL